MRVVGLVSSPRKGGNSELAVKEMLSRMPDDWEKNMIRLNELNIMNCTACYSCVPEGAKCRLKDDLDFLVRNIKHADKVVIAAPAYMLGGHTALKPILDRLISLVSDYKLFNNTDCVMVAPFGFAGWDGMVKEDMILFARKLHLKLLGTEVILATLPGDSVKGENLEKLHALTDLLIKGSDEKPAPTSEALECPFCSSTAFNVKPDGSMRCSVCGGEAKLVSGDSGFKLDYDPAFNHRLTHKSLDIHVDYLLEKKQLFLDTRNDVKAIQAKYADIDWWIKPESKTE